MMVRSSGRSGPPGGSVIDLRLLGYFVAVAEELHFGRAAARLQMAQPPLSAAIKTLEGRLGLTLLDRGPRRVALTDAGDLLLERSRELLRRHASLLAEMAALRRSETRSLRVAFPGPFAGLLVASALRAFTRESRDAHVDLRDVGPWAGANPVSSAHADVAVVVGERPGVVVASLFIATSPVVFVLGATHERATASTLAALELRDEPHVQFDQATASWRDAWTPRGVSGVDPPWASNARTFEEALDLAAAGCGVVMAPALVSERHPRTDVRFVPVIDMPPVPIHVAWRHDDASSVVAEFVAAVRELPAATPDTPETYRR